VMLPIRRSAVKKCVAADSEIGSDGGVIWALLLSLSLSLSLSLGVYSLGGWLSMLLSLF
jgi:hypothetical protein